VSEEPYQGSDQKPEGNYLFWALLGTALVVAVGATALLRKMTERPELAAADPLLVTVLRWARSLAMLGLAVIGGLVAVQFFSKKKRIEPA
jgi:hypothetical protein